MLPFAFMFPAPRILLPASPLPSLLCQLLFSVFSSVYTVLGIFIDLW